MVLRSPDEHPLAAGARTRHEATSPGQIWGIHRSCPGRPGSVRAVRPVARRTGWQDLTGRCRDVGAADDVDQSFAVDRLVDGAASVEAVERRYPRVQEHEGDGA